MEIRAALESARRQPAHGCAGFGLAHGAQSGGRCGSNHGRLDSRHVEADYQEGKIQLGDEILPVVAGGSSDFHWMLTLCTRFPILCAAVLRIAPILSKSSTPLGNCVLTTLCKWVDLIVRVAFARYLCP